MKIMSFIKNIIIGSLLVQHQTQAAVLNDGAASCEGEVFNPCEPFGFHVAVGQPTRDTTRWMLAEMHNHSAESEACMAVLAKLPGETTFYLEGIDAEVGEVQCNHHIHTAQLGSRVKCRGWDNKDGQYESYESDPDVMFTEYFRRLRHMYDSYKMSEQALKVYLNDLITTNKYDAALEKIVSKRHMKKEKKLLKKVAKKLLEEREKASSFNEVFEKYKGSKTVHFRFDDMYKREHSLMTALRHYSDEDNRQVVVAGGAHFLPTYFNPHPSARDYVKRELAKDKAHNGTSYTILKFNP